MSPVVADAVEKVRGILLTCNNRITGVDFLNRTCAFDAHFESILLRDPPQIFFRQHRPNPDNGTAARDLLLCRDSSCRVRHHGAAGSVGYLHRTMVRQKTPRAGSAIS
jgi:hypothetical protein